MTNIQEVTFLLKKIRKINFLKKGFSEEFLMKELKNITKIEFIM